MPKATKAPTARTATFQRSQPRTGGSKAKTGTWIFKTQAMKKYHLTAAQMEEIPILAREANPHDPNGPEATKYSEREVLKASQKLGEELVTQEVNEYAPWLAMEKGSQILRTKAVEKYKLKTWQLDRIKPTDEQTNPHNAKGPKMRHYNVCDIKALATALNIPLPVPTPRKPRASTSKAAAATEFTPAPATPKKKAAPKARAGASTSARSMYEHDDEYYQDGIFDGMSSRDAAEKFAELTGIMGPAMAHWEF
ncbi:hypothetical protein C8F01DRAFT_1075779 [Mycena amicta]|nr:hypothetical protein C8F01DRAFT_1075779 [Mycena amicta]